MTNEMIENRLKQIVSAQLDIPIEQIKKDSKFHANLGLDSLDVVNLLSAINLEFGIQLFEQDVTEIETPAQMVECIASRLQNTE